MADRLSDLRVWSGKPWYLGALALIGGFMVYTYSTQGLAADALFWWGTWFVLGGFTLFIPTSGVHLLFGIGLVVGLIFSVKQTHIHSTAEKLSINDQKVLGKKDRVEITRSEIESITIESHSVGKRIWWLLPIGLHIAYMLTDGLHLLTNPHNFGYGLVNGWLYVVTGIIDVGLLGLIFLSKDILIKIETVSHLYLIDLTPITKYPAVLDHVALHLGGQNPSVSPSSSPSASPSSSPSASLSSSPSASLSSSPAASPSSSPSAAPTLTPTLNSHRAFLIWGIGYLFISIISRVFNILMGSPLRVPLFLLGLGLICLGIHSPTQSSYRKSPQDGVPSAERPSGFGFLLLMMIFTAAMVGLTIVTRLYYLPSWNTDLGSTISILGVGCGVLLSMSWLNFARTPKFSLKALGGLVVGAICGASLILVF